MPPKQRFEYRAVPLHCTEDGAVNPGDVSCVDEAGGEGWRVVPGTEHSFMKKRWVLMEREK